MMFWRKKKVPEAELPLSQTLGNFKIWEDLNSNPLSCHQEIAYEDLLDNGCISPYQLDNIIFDTFESLKSNEERLGLRFLNVEGCLESVIEQIKKNELWVGSIDFNDALDPLFVSYLRMNRQNSKDTLTKKWYNALLSSIEKLRICCLCNVTNGAEEVVNNHVMWGNYANHHKGLGIVYRITSQNQFVDKNNCSFSILRDIDYVNKILTKDEITLKDAFFTKITQWKYEKEMRFLSFDPKYPILKKKSSWGGVKIANTPVEEVYIGVNASKETEQTILKELSGLSIRIYRMYLNSKNLNSLIAKRLI